jgi:DTW domain-containing protein YfiP
MKCANKNAKKIIYCDKIWKCKHKMNKTTLWNKNVPRISVEHTKGNGSLTFINTFLWT